MLAEIHAMHRLHRTDTRRVLHLEEVLIPGTQIECCYSEMSITCPDKGQHEISLFSFCCNVTIILWICFLTDLTARPRECRLRLRDFR